MKIYVDINAGRGGSGSKEMPFRCINDAAQAARPGDEVLVAPGVYREYVNPKYAGTEDARIRWALSSPVRKKLKTGNIMKAMCGSAGLTILFSEIITLIPHMSMATGILPDAPNIPALFI